jgi:outer membrane receptor for ferric coprogen and ferric-rhodotorulic acid
MRNKKIIIAAVTLLASGFAWAEGSGTTDVEATTHLESMEIRSTSPEQEYFATDATTATKMDVPIRDVPQSIETCPVSFFAATTTTVPT